MKELCPFQLTSFKETVLLVTRGWVEEEDLIESDQEHYLFYDGSPCHIETSLLICSANQCSGFSIIGIFVIKELMKHNKTLVLLQTSHRNSEKTL